MEDQLYFRKGQKALLRPVLKEDVPHFMRWMNDPEVSQFLQSSHPVTIEDEQEWYDKNCKANEHKALFAIVDVETNALIGNMAMFNISVSDGTAITGAVIGDKEYWGKGYGTEAKMLMLEYAFHELNLRKIYSYVYEYNKRSVAYSKRCGYVEEALLPKHIYRKGKYWDVHVLAVYRPVWEKLWKKFKL